LASASRFSTNTVGIVCGTGASLCWAAGFAGTRYGLNAGFSPVDLTIHRFLWLGLAMFPSMVLSGMGDLYGVGWGRGIVLAVLGGPVFSVLSYAGFLLVPLGHGGIIQPSVAMLGGILLAALFLHEKLPVGRAIGALVIVCGLAVIGAEAVTTIGVHGIAGDLIFVLAGLMFATFGTLLRLWRIGPIPAAAVIGVLSLPVLPPFWAMGGFGRMIALGWRENLLQAVLQGVVMGYGAIYLFVKSITLLGAGRAAVFPALVPPFVLLTGWIALGEVPSDFQLIGLAVVLAGFSVAQRAA
jgi:drug/metabolite transporter (DMT)-like permease